jgi:hypothetical protein
MENGIHRAVSGKGKGYWIARWKDQEKVFYDGVFGTETSAKNAAQKWLNALAIGKGSVEWNDKVEEVMKWMDEQSERFGKDTVKEIQDMMIEKLTV